MNCFTPSSFKILPKDQATTKIMQTGMISISPFSHFCIACVGVQILERIAIIPAPRGPISIPHVIARVMSAFKNTCGNPLIPIFPDQKMTAKMVINRTNIGITMFIIDTWASAGIFVSSEFSSIIGVSLGPISCPVVIARCSASYIAPISKPVRTTTRTVIIVKIA